MKRIILLITAWLTLITASAAARVSLLTVDAGRDVYELEGHTALRIVTPDYDVTVSWGVFDFNSPNFLYRFVKGETDYLCVGMPTEAVIREYTASGRRVVEQTLDLDSVQTQRIVAMALQNMLPENSVYRYNYVKDNCSLRPLVMIERATADSLRFSTPQGYPYGYTGVKGDADSEATFRSEMSAYHKAYPWYQFGIDLALGSGIDYKINPYERAYAPLYLHDYLAGATIDGRPLVSSEQVLVPGVAGGTSLKPTPWPLTPVAVSLYLLAITLMVTWRDLRRRRISRWFDSALYGIFFVAGCLLTFLIFVSTHEATSPNWLFLWLNPFCIIPVVFEWIKSGHRVVYCYQFCNFAALVVLLAGQHWLGQALNAAFPILIACDLVRSFSYIYLYRKPRR